MEQGARDSGGPPPHISKGETKTWGRERQGNPHLNKTPSVQTKPALTPPLSHHFLFTQAHIRGATITMWPSCKRHLPRIYKHIFFFFYRYEKQNCGLSSLNVSSLLPSGHVCSSLQTCFRDLKLMQEQRQKDLTRLPDGTIRREVFRKTAFLLLQLSAFPLFLFDSRNGSIGGFVTLSFHKTFEDISLPYCFLIPLLASNKDQSSFFFFFTSWLRATEIVNAVPWNQMPNGSFLTYNFL